MVGSQKHYVAQKNGDANKQNKTKMYDFTFMKSQNTENYDYYSQVSGYLGQVFGKLTAKGQKEILGGDGKVLYLEWGGGDVGV